MPEEGAAKVSSLSGLRKAAIMLVALDQDTAAKVMSMLDKQAIEDVSREIASLEDVTPEERDAVVREFYNLALARSYVEQGGLKHAQTLLEKSLSKEEAAEIIKQVSQAIATTPFQFLQKTDPENLLTFIQEEQKRQQGQYPRQEKCAHPNYEEPVQHIDDSARQRRDWAQFVLSQKQPH